MLLGLTKRIILVDAETSSNTDLPKRGSDVYFNDKSTRTLMVSFTEHGSGRVHLYQPHLHALPKMLVEAAALPPEESRFAAYNAPFDRQALALAGLPTPTEKWVDLMLLAYALAFSGGLDSVLAQFNVTDAQGRPCKKSPEGKALIRRFSVQQQPWFDAPEEWSRFASYCVQDTEVEDRLLTKCLTVLDRPAFHPMVAKLQQQWLLDQRMNAAGMPLSTATIRGAIAIKAQETKRLTAQMKAVTGLANPNSVAQLRGWVESRGVPMPDLQAANIRDALQDPTVPPDVAEVLQARLELGKASIKKFDAMARMQVGGRIRGGYITCGASRTGRTASRGLNLSNLERPKLKGPMADLAADLIEMGDTGLLRTWLDPKAAKLSTMELLGSSIRGAIAAPPGKTFVVADLKSIESVGAAWLAGCDTILDLFAAGRDTYKDFATRYYGIAYEDVTSEQRTFCKPPVLGAGYGASGAALVDYAAGMNITMGHDDADRAITIFRESFWEIPLLWRNLEAAAKSAVQNPGREYRAYACAGQNQYGPLYRDWPFVSYYKEGDFLYCGLPSGRTLFYYKPEVISERRRSVRTGNDYNAQTLYYWGKRQEAGGAWGFISTWGGMWLENVCQATCRDVLYNGLELMHQDPGIEVCGSTYDEAITLTDEADGPAAYDRMVRYMTTRPSWADERFFLGADGYHSARRYRK